MHSTNEQADPFLPLQPGRSPSSFSARWAKILLTSLLIAFLFSFAYTSVLLFNWARDVVAHAAQVPDVALVNLTQPEPNVTPPVFPDETPNPDSPPPAIQPVPTWDVSQQQRVNILLLGVDQRPNQTIPGLTDTMLLLTIDPANGQVGMLSIPRDTWVKIPGYEIYNKINTAHRIGEIKEYPGGGPALAKQTVSELIGYPVHYFVRVNFDGFREIIDLVDGVDIDVPRDLNDPTYPSDDYGYDPLFIPKGRQHMDGALALKYARTRHVDNDFQRGRRQQQVLLALKEKVLNAGMLPTLIGNLPALVRSLSQSMQTDIPLDRLIALAELARQVDFDRIDQAVFDCTMGECTYSEGGAWILIPSRDKIQQVIDGLFDVQAPVEGSTPIASGNVTTTISVTATATVTPTALALTGVIDREQLRLEKAQIIVLNGTSTSGLAKRTANWLKSLGFDVISVGDADRNSYTRSTIFTYASTPYTLKQLANLFDAGSADVRSAPPDQSGAEIRLVLGRDAPDILQRAGAK